jgi:hypothetical protein
MMCCSTVYISAKKYNVYYYSIYLLSDYNILLRIRSR